MPLPTGFQLGLELTNIASPLSTALSKLGSLALIDAIKRSGSDAITEMKLASLLGRHRIDPVMEISFRRVVAKSDQSVISRYVDIILESGAGPTVQEALKNPALFSMIIQLSLLAFAHEDVPLANAAVAAIENILRDSGADLEATPDYVSLLGTIRACQQQTAAFHWLWYYDAVESKIRAALETSQGDDQRMNRGAKRRRIQSPRKGMPKSITTRSMPFAVFQTLLMWLQSLQSFPEDRLLQIKSDTGLSTIVVWCHYVLGLTVNLRLSRGGDIGFGQGFGQGLSNVYLEECKPKQACASLLDAVDKHEPLFSLSASDEDPFIGFEDRADAYGYGVKILKLAASEIGELQMCSHWIIGRGISLFRSSITSNEDELPETALPHMHLTERKVVHAGSFLFALDHVDMAIVETSMKESLKKSKDMRTIMSRVNWPSLVAILLTFARIRDLEQCINLPLSTEAYWQLQKDDHGIEKFDLNASGPLPDLILSFKLLSRLLLGHCFSDDYVKPAVLISAWGWSLFLDCIDAADPVDVSIETFRVMQGVPSRRGVRKTRIIDGPTDVRLSSTLGETLDHQDHVTYFPGVSTARRGPVLVGHHGSDAFSITQSFDWQSYHRLDKKYKVGFREMQNLRMAFDVLPPCECEDSALEDLKLIDDIMRGESGLIWEHGQLRNIYKPRWPEPGEDLNVSPERVFVKRFVGPSAPGEIQFPGSSNVKYSEKDATGVWFFYVTQNNAARWLQLNDIYWYTTRDRDIPCVVRGKDCCIKCVFDNHLLSLSEKSGLIFVLL